MTINAGRLDIGSSGALNSTTPNAVAFGPGSTGTLALNGNSISIGGLSGNSTAAVVENDSTTAATLTVIESGNETFAGSLQNNNTGTGGALSLVKAGAGSLTLSGSNTFSGGVAINAGTLQMGSADALGPNLFANAVTDNGTLTLNGNSVNLASLTGSGIVQNANAASATLTLGNLANGANGTFAGTLQDGAGGGKLSLVVIGNGNGFVSGNAEQILSGNNKFTGGVTINGGVLASSGSLVANVAIINGGTFFLAGGSLLGDATNSATFIYSGGTFGGRLIGAGGTLEIAAPITIAYGLENDGELTLAATFDFQGTTFPDAPITLGGPGLDNEGTLTMAGGTLILSTSPSAANVNRGTFNLSPTVPFNLNGATLTNSGALNLNGGTINGAGLLSNGVGGTISGTGTITCPFSNAGLLELTGGTLNSSQPFSNSGLIELNGTANLAGGAITNSGTIFGTGTISSVLNNNGTLIVGAGLMSIAQASTNAGLIQLTAVNSNLFGGAIINGATGTIQGIGVVGSAVTNNGTIESMGGTLSLGGPLTNPAGGLLAVDAGSKMFITGGLAANAGIINLTGGTYDNSGHALNNTGQISGWGIFRTGGSGLDNNGSITFSGGTTTVNGPVTNENGKTITVAYNPAIFTGLVTNTGTGTFNVINTTVVFAGGSTGNVPLAPLANAPAAAFAKAGSGLLEVDGAPSLGNGSSMAIGDTGTLRFKATAGAASVGTGVTATVASGATLELAGSVSSLSSGANRVNITNNSAASAGILVSGTNQQVGNIDGNGTTQVNAGSDLTANHILQGALIIGGAAGTPGMVTIDASDASGNPLNSSSGLAVSDSLTPSEPFGVGETGSASVSSVDQGVDVTAVSLGNSVGGDPSPVPEPSTLLLALLAVLGVVISTMSQTSSRKEKYHVA